MLPRCWWRGPWRSESPRSWRRIPPRCGPRSGSCVMPRLARVRIPHSPALDASAPAPGTGSLAHRRCGGSTRPTPVDPGRPRPPSLRTPAPKWSCTTRLNRAR
ncbi:hypothetical protein N791_03080 [Lysobacter defluvii IMMIB APB-9 = DSM 18482]|uniref:Uncharacterized protein n=1 Tax=Lysobacter defluvii IMMIB APB-9 = DSM 18482 TaxID=1385515 RepID=A0A0A0M5G9_9GAMM|nr:hypothetical protein N791_03080 [Lysobacter defluvii IMMIB APB-9 = DSM 18482]